MSITDRRAPRAPRRSLFFAISTSSLHSCHFDNHPLDCHFDDHREEKSPPSWSQTLIAWAISALKMTALLTGVTQFTSNIRVPLSGHLLSGGRRASPNPGYPPAGSGRSYERTPPMRPVGSPTPCMVLCILKCPGNGPEDTLRGGLGACNSPQKGVRGTAPAKSVEHDE